MATYSLDEVVSGKKTYSLDEVVAPVAGAEAVAEINSIPRQLGLTGRYLAEGLADYAGIFTEPVRVGMNKLLGTDLMPIREATSNLLDRAGVPNPQTAQERVVGDASRMLVGTGGIVKGASAMATNAPTIGQSVIKAITANPSMQAASSVGAGYAGGTARENGEGAGGQFAASLVGGIASPLALSGLSSVANSAARSIKNTFAPQQLDLQVDNVLRQSGVDLNAVHGSIRNGIRDDIKQALTYGDDISPDAVRRLADYRALGATPMRSNLTLNPADVTRDRNLAKLGAGSTDEAAQSLAMLQNKNNATLIDNLNTLGANTTDDAYSAGSKIIGALEARDNSAKNIIGAFYDNARNTNGRSANLDPSAFTQRANDLLDSALLGGKLPADVRNLLNKTASGQMPLTVDVAEQFKTRIGDLQRATSDMAERKALGLVRSALDDAPLLDQVGQGAIDAFNSARRVNRAYMQVVEKTPALQAVRDGIEPDKFVQKFIIGSGEKSNVMDVAMLKKNIKGNKEAMGAIKGQILAHLKNKALNGNADEVANFSPSAFNQALKAIGERKLNLFFDKQEIEQLNRIARVGSYEAFQPKGSAVNNSNTASAVGNHALDFINKYIPLGKAVVGDPVQNIKLSLGARGSLNAPKSLVLEQQKQQKFIPMFPLLTSQGLLSE